MKRQLLTIAAAVILVCASVTARAYNLYIGDLHTHTSFSDGKGLPENAYDTARTTGHFDFLAVTDHVERLGPREDLPPGAPKEDKYEAMKKAALAKNEDGKFVAIVGFEWATDPAQGHANILYANETTNFGNGYPLLRMYKWLAKHPDALMGFNHPNEGAEQKKVFDHMAYVPQIASQTIYVATNVPLDFPFYYMALDNGWWVAPSAQEDNHNTNWGSDPSGDVTGVYANELTFAAIKDALVNRRFYATNDRAIALWFAADGQPMGSQLAAGGAKLDIDVKYKSGEKLKSVKLISNKGAVVKEWTPATAEFKDSMAVIATPGARTWYVVLAVADNGRFAISAPIILGKQ